MDPVLSLPTQWVRAFAVFIAVAAVLYLGGIVVSGAGQSVQALSRLGWTTALVGTAAASSAFLIRFARWQWLLARLKHHLAFGYSLRVYLAGLALTSSPGKLGETVRSVLLLRKGISLSHSLGAFLADRGADVVGMAALGAIAGLLASARSPALEWLVVGLLVSTPTAAWAVRRPWFGAFAARVAVPWPRLARAAHRAAGPVAAWARLWTPLAFLAYSAFAFVAYGVQALVFAAYVDALGGNVGTMRCLAIFANAMLLGAASMVPAGLGATEGALVYQLAAAGMELPVAVAAAIAVRLSTLWFAIVIGVLALLTFARPEPERNVYDQR